MKLELITNIKGGKMQPKHSRMIVDYIQSFEGKAVHITVDKHSGKRSHRQNALWWVYVTILANEIGYNKNEMHEILKMKFLKKQKVDEKTGECFEYLGSTTELNKTEFGEMINSLVQWAAETFNVVMPLPDTQLEIN
jgi:hypothetical protein